MIDATVGVLQAAVVNALTIQSHACPNNCILALEVYSEPSLTIAELCNHMYTSDFILKYYFQNASGDGEINSKG